MNDATGQKTPRSATFFRMYDEEDAKQGARPPCLGEPEGPLGRIQRGIAQIDDQTFVLVQIIDAS